MGIGFWAGRRDLGWSARRGGRGRALGTGQEGKGRSGSVLRGASHSFGSVPFSTPLPPPGVWAWRGLRLRCYVHQKGAPFLSQTSPTGLYKSLFFRNRPVWIHLVFINNGFLIGCECFKISLEI
jgi:hypothetical protein